MEANDWAGFYSFSVAMEDTVRKMQQENTELQEQIKVLNDIQKENANVINNLKKELESLRTQGKND